MAVILIQGVESAGMESDQEMEAAGMEIDEDDGSVGTDFDQEVESTGNEMDLLLECENIDTDNETEEASECEVSINAVSSTECLRNIGASPSTDYM